MDDLIKEIDPYEQLDDDVKDAMLSVADEFVENVITQACQVAKHRNASTVDVKDVQLVLGKNLFYHIVQTESYVICNRFIIIKHCVKKIYNLMIMKFFK